MYIDGIGNIGIDYINMDDTGRWVSTLLLTGLCPVHLKFISKNQAHPWSQRSSCKAPHMLFSHNWIISSWRGGSLRLRKLVKLTSLRRQGHETYNIYRDPPQGPVSVWGSNMWGGVACRRRALRLSQWTWLQVAQETPGCGFLKSSPRLWCICLESPMLLWAPALPINSLVHQAHLG